MTGGIRKKTGFSIHLLVVLLFFVCAIVVALLVRGNGCCVVVQVAVLPRLISAGSSWDASPAATTPSGSTATDNSSWIPAASSTRGASSPDDDRQEASEAVAASEEEEAPAAAPYAADSRWNIQWESVASVLSSFSSNGGTGRRGIARVGLLNFNSSEVARWRSTLPAADVRAVPLAPAADDVTWESLYPGWIDEGSNRSSCPSLPDPDAAPHHTYDLVAVKLPCRAQEWSRDVRRLHLQLASAKLTLHGNGSSSKAGMVLILSGSTCVPLPNLFPCKHLLARRGHAFLYRPDATYLRHRVDLPVGSCQLAVPFLRRPAPDKEPQPPSATPAPGSTISRISRQAYATVLHSADAYVCGAIALARSIRESGSTRDLVALVDAHNVGAEHRAALAAAGWDVRLVPRIRNPHAKAHAYNEWNYSKFRLWQLTDYDKVVFLDADLLVLRNMDFLFEEAPELSATVNSGARFNSGVMVLEPCTCTFDLLMSGIHDIESYNGGDQGYLNEVFTWWHRLPRQVNFLKFAWPEGDRAAQARMLAAEPAEVHAVHYLGVKPWMCYRDYDCNWNVAGLRRFASDEAHARWWAVHDRIEPAELREKFCALPASRLKVLEQQRREAATVNAPDGHWNRTITDPRRHIKVQNPAGQAKSRNALRTAWAWLRKMKS